MFSLLPHGSLPTGTLGAALDTVVDASTPTSPTPVLDFDGSQDEHREWRRQVPSNYSGGGFTWSYKYSMDGTDGSAVEMELRIFTMTDASSVLTADLGIDTQTASTIADTPSDSVANTWNETATGTLSHANAGSPSAGDYVVIRATRDFDHAANTDDLQLGAILILET